MKSKATLFPAWTIYGLVLAIPGLSFAAVATAASNFTDANWSSMGGFPGANGPVYTGAVDGSGNLYISGPFTLVCDVVADGLPNGTGPVGQGSGRRIRTWRRSR